MPLFGLSWLLIQTALRIKDYVNPIELEGMRREAKQKSFDILLKEYQSLDPLLAHQIVSSSEIKFKFQEKIQGKTFVSILEEFPLSYIFKYDLLTQKEIRNLFYHELKSFEEIHRLYEKIGDMVLHELKRFEVISHLEYERLAVFQIEEEEMDISQRASLLKLESEFLGRRDFLIWRLGEIEKQYKMRLSTKKTLHRQIVAIQREKERIEKDPEVGLLLQERYLKALKALNEKYQDQRKLFKEEFAHFKEQFLI